MKEKISIINKFSCLETIECEVEDAPNTCTQGKSLWSMRWGWTRTIGRCKSVRMRVYQKGILQNCSVKWGVILQNSFKCLPSEDVNLPGKKDFKRSKRCSPSHW